MTKEIIHLLRGWALTGTVCGIGWDEHVPLAGVDGRNWEIIPPDMRCEDCQKHWEGCDYICLAVGTDEGGVVTACGPVDQTKARRTTGFPPNTTCPECLRNPLYSWSLPIALRPGEARRGP